MKQVWGWHVLEGSCDSFLSLGALEFFSSSNSWEFCAAAVFILGCTKHDHYLRETSQLKAYSREKANVFSAIITHSK